MRRTRQHAMLNARRMIIGLIAALIMACGIAVWLIVNTEEVSEPVILRADGKPYKVKPADPGGKPLDNLDSPMMDRLNNDSPVADDATEVLVPPEAEPELPPISVEPEPSSVEPEPSPALDPQPETAAKTPKQSQKEPEAKPLLKPESKPEQKTESETTQTTETRRDKGGGGFYVQFAAFRSEQSARETAALLTTKHASRLNGMSLGFTRKGEYWRVVTDPLSRDDAAALCRVFVSVGQDCIVKSLDIVDSAEPKNDN